METRESFSSNPVLEIKGDCTIPWGIMAVVTGAGRGEGKGGCHESICSRRATWLNSLWKMDWMREWPDRRTYSGPCQGWDQRGGRVCKPAEEAVIWTSFSSVQFHRSVVSESVQSQGLQHARLPCPSLTPGVYSSSCPSSQWCHPTISSSVIPFCLQSFPASGSFPVSQFFASGGQSIGVSASASDLSMNIQDWFPLGWTGWNSLLFKGLSRVFMGKGKSLECGLWVHSPGTSVMGWQDGRAISRDKEGGRRQTS